MERKDWLALCAVHSDAWLMSLAFFYSARFDADGRAELFSLVNQHPTVYEVVTGRVARNKMYKRKQPKVQAAAAPAPVAVYEPEPNPFVRPGYQAADQVPALVGACVGRGCCAALACRPSVHDSSFCVAAPADVCAPMSPLQPLPTGRLLTAADVSPALTGRQAELFWPDDGKWYLIQFNQVDMAARKAE
jgi:hypothetical protein